MKEPVNFIVDAKGLRILVMDDSHVSMFDFFMPRAAFSLFRCKKKTKIGINLESLNKILKRFSDKTELKLKLDPKGNKLHFESDGEIQEFFTLILEDVEEEQYPVPQVGFTAEITIGNGSLFSKAIKNIEIFSNVVEIIADSNEVTIFGKGDNGEASLVIPKEEIEIRIEEKSVSKYPLSYLENIVKIMPITEELFIAFSSDNPIKLECKLESDTGIYLKYYISPRVEEEEYEGELEESERGKSEE